jgi:hypothetical protein
MLHMHTALHAGRSQVRFPIISLEFFIAEVFAAESTPNRNEYQEYFLEGEGGRCVRLTTLHFYVPFIIKSGSLNLLETSRRVQTSTGIDLPLNYLLIT